MWMNYVSIWMICTGECMSMQVDECHCVQVNDHCMQVYDGEL